MRSASPSSSTEALQPRPRPAPPPRPGVALRRAAPAPLYLEVYAHEPRRSVLSVASVASVASLVSLRSTGTGPRSPTIPVPPPSPTEPHVQREAALRAAEALRVATPDLPFGTLLDLPRAPDDSVFAPARTEPLAPSPLSPSPLSPLSRLHSSSSSNLPGGYTPPVSFISLAHRAHVPQSQSTTTLSTRSPSHSFSLVGDSVLSLANRPEPLRACDAAHARVHARRAARLALEGGASTPSLPIQSPHLSPSQVASPPAGLQSSASATNLKVHWDSRTYSLPPPLVEDAVSIGETPSPPERKPKGRLRRALGEPRVVKWMRKMRPFGSAPVPAASGSSSSENSSRT
jgi:hypothetical protein